MKNNPYAKFENPYVVEVQQPVAILDNSPEPTWTCCPLVMSIIGILFCPILGGIALKLSHMARQDHHDKNFTGYKEHKNCGYGFAISAILSGTIVAIVYFLLID